MGNRKLLGLVFTTASIVLAVAILAILLLIATARTPEQLRQIAQDTSYLEQAATSISRGIEVSAAQHQALGADVQKIDLAMQQGSETLSIVLRQTYQPSGVLAQARWYVIDWLNLIDSSAGELSEPAQVLDLGDQLTVSLVQMRDEFVAFGSSQKDLFAAETAYAQAANTTVGTLREAGDQKRADSVYVNTEQVKSLLRRGRTEELDGVLAIIDELEKVESSLPANQRGDLRSLINTTYTMISLRRAMNQSVDAMQQDYLLAQLEQFGDVTTSDQLYVLSAVNDARVLLNVYTVLMLAVLGFFGLRLAASHRALNRSHDDLEVRVVERTADLAQANENLKESQVQLVQAEKMSSLGQLVAGVMHEINTPLLYVLNNTSVTAEAVAELGQYVGATTPILTAKTSEEGKQAIKQFLARRREFDVEELTENMQEIESLGQDSIDGLNQISDLVQSLKDFSRLDRVADDTFDVREGIEKTLTITRSLLKQGVEVHKDFADVPEIFCSPSRLNQVFINIITNAVQAMDGRGILKISTALNRSSQGDSVEIVFEDTGCGIPQEHLDKIMDPFFTTKPVGEGTGLGLSIVHQIVEQHDGQIYVDSREGIGTRIVLSFPVTGPVQKSVETEEAA